MTPPAREPYFAFRFCRLLGKRVVANELGAATCWLLTMIVMQQDARRYTGAVTFYNGQLLPICGFDSVGRLDRCRKKAIDAGWLHYECGGKGRPGNYWVLIPPAVECDDTPLDEGLPAHLPIQNGQPNGRTNGRQTRDKRKASDHLPTLPLSPGPNTPPIALKGDPASPDERATATTGSATVTKKSQSSSTTPDGFEDWWSLYPRQEKKPRAINAFRKAIKSLALKHPSTIVALEWLKARTQLFAISESGQGGQFCPLPSTWLRDESFNDDPAEWNRRRQPNSRTTAHQFGAGQIHQSNGNGASKVDGDWSN